MRKISVMRTEFNSNIEARPSLFKRAHKEIGMSHAFWVSLYIQDKMQNVGQYLILFVNQPNTDLIVFKSYPSNLYTQHITCSVHFRRIVWLKMLIYRNV